MFFICKPLKDRQNAPLQALDKDRLCLWLFFFAIREKKLQIRFFYATIFLTNDTKSLTKRILLLQKEGSAENPKLKQIISFQKIHVIIPTFSFQH